MNRFTLALALVLLGTTACGDDTKSSSDDTASDSGSTTGAASVEAVCEAYAPKAMACGNPASEEEIRMTCINVIETASAEYGDECLTAQITWHECFTEQPCGSLDCAPEEVAMVCSTETGESEN